jgi:N-acyl-D-aspartate/D-glutamate deacylase
MPKPLLMRYCFRRAFLLDTIPGWAKPMALPVADKLALFRDPTRRRELEDLAARPGKHAMHAVWATRRIEETFSAETKRYEGRLVGDIAADEGKRPFDVLADVACEDELRTVFANVPPEESDADWAAQRKVWRDERALIGGSDAGAHLDFLSTFNLQTWFLSHVVQDRQVISLEEAVHHFTGAPAALYGLRDRGRLVEGAWADVVVFDERNVGSGKVYTRFDLPAGAGRLYAEPIGVEHVLVNGAEVAASGELRDVRPGRLLRSGRDSYTPSLDATWTAAPALAGTGD